MNNNLQVSSADFVNYHYSRLFQQKLQKMENMEKFNIVELLMSNFRGWGHAGATLGECWRGFVVENYLG